MIRITACILLANVTVFANDGDELLATAAKNHVTIESLDSWTGTMQIVHLSGTDSEYPVCPIAKNDKDRAERLFATGHGAIIPDLIPPEWVAGLP